MQTKKNSELTLHWIITLIMLGILIAYNIICHTYATDIQSNTNEEQRVLIRTIFYIITIILFPLVNLIRYVLLRLNQTMPSDNSAKNRYLMTTIVTLVLIEIVGIFGFILFILGDGYNTLTIFSILATLGIFLHRPKQNEYDQIIDALKKQ